VPNVLLIAQLALFALPAIEYQLVHATNVMIQTVYNALRIAQLVLNAKVDMWFLLDLAELVVNSSHSKLNDFSINSKYMNF
jgi:hypothetical protein